MRIARLIMTLAKAKLIADLSAMDFLLQRATPLNASRQALALVLLDSIGSQLERTSHKGYFLNELSVAVRSSFEESFALNALTSSLEKAGIADSRTVAMQSLLSRIRDCVQRLRNDALNGSIRDHNGDHNGQ